MDKLETLEEKSTQGEAALDEEDELLSLADIFPVPTASASRRGESPERKFVVSFRPTSSRNDTAEQQELHNARSPSLPLRCKEVARIEDPTLYQEFDRNDDLKPFTSQLVLGIIPHRNADKIVQGTQNVSGSVLIEARAEETVDDLMRRWTYLDPRYFSDSDVSRFSSTEDVSTRKPDVRRSEGRMDKPKAAPIESTFGPRSGFGGRRMRKHKSPPSVFLGETSPQADSSVITDECRGRRPAPKAHFRRYRRHRRLYRNPNIILSIYTRQALQAPKSLAVPRHHIHIVHRVLAPNVTQHQHLP